MKRREAIFVLVLFFLLNAGLGVKIASAGPRPVDLAAAVNYQHWLATGNWLSGDYTLDLYSQRVAQRLADTGTLTHSDVGSLLGCQWGVVAENIGVGFDIASIVQAWMASPSHELNITSDFTYLGVGLVERDGRLWVVTVFAK